MVAAIFVGVVASGATRLGYEVRRPLRAWCLSMHVSGVEAQSFAGCSICIDVMFPSCRGQEADDARVNICHCSSRPARLIPKGGVRPFANRGSYDVGWAVIDSDDAVFVEDSSQQM